MRENPSKIGDLGVPPFQEITISDYVFVFTPGRSASCPVDDAGQSQRAAHGVAPRAARTHQAW